MMNQYAGWREAVRHLKRDWYRRAGDHLASVHKSDMDDKAPGLILEYVRLVAREGARSRYKGPKQRVMAKPHPSLLNHLASCAEKVIKDAQKGRAFAFVTEDVEEEYQDGLMASASGVVKKYFPDRSEDPEGRHITDMRPHNLDPGCHKYNHPPAGQPTHAMVARETLWWSELFPLIDVLCAKKDIKAAFKLVYLAEEDVYLFVIEIPGEVCGRPGKSITVVSLVLNFGWSGSPGEYQIFATLAKLYHQAHYPNRANFNTSVAFNSHFMVDDQQLIEPLLGDRPWQSIACARRGTVKAMGESAPNDEKDAEEGQMEPRKRVWGLDMDSREKSVTLPPLKLQKVAAVLSDPRLDAGSEWIEVLMLQILRGNMQYWLIVNPSLRAEVGAVDRALGLVEPGNPHLVWKRDATEVAHIINDLCDTVELCRLMLGVPERRQSHFVSGMADILGPRERLGLAGQAERAVWLGSDATPTAVAAIDWTNKVFFSGDVSKYWDRLVDLTGRGEESKLIVAVAEMMSLVIIAAAAGELWCNRLVLYLGDNMNVISWLNGKAPKNVFARHLLRCLIHLQTRHTWGILAGYVRTYHNDTDDYFTRAALVDVESRAQELALTRVEGQAQWEECMRLGVNHRAITWESLGGDWRLAYQLRELRVKRRVPRTL